MSSSRSIPPPPASSVSIPSSSSTSSSRTGRELLGTPWSLENPKILENERRRQRIRRKRRERHYNRWYQHQQYVNSVLTMIPSNDNGGNDEDDDSDSEASLRHRRIQQGCTYICQAAIVVIVILVIILSVTSLVDFLSTRSSSTTLPWWRKNFGFRGVGFNSPLIRDDIESTASVIVTTLCPRVDRGPPLDIPNSIPVNNTLNVHIVVSVFHESIQWIYDHFAGRYPIIELSRDRPKNPENVEPNVAYEALALIRYINRHYDNLPDRILFVHGDRYPWHVVGGDMVPLIASIDTSLHWASLNLNMYFNIDRFRSGIDIRHWEEIEQLWKEAELDQFIGPPPDRVASYCCAQFLVSKDQIRRRSKAFWDHLDKWLSKGGMGGGKKVAVAFEHSWYYLFTGKQEEPRIRDPCEIFDCNIYKGTKKITRCCTPLGLPPLCPP